MHTINLAQQESVKWARINYNKFCSTNTPVSFLSVSDPLSSSRLISKRTSSFSLIILILSGSSVTSELWLFFGRPLRVRVWEDKPVSSSEERQLVEERAMLFLVVRVRREGSGSTEGFTTLFRAGFRMRDVLELEAFLFFSDFSTTAGGAASVSLSSLNST